MPLQTELLDRSVRETWEALFGCSVEPLPGPIPHAERQQFLTALVQISGEWLGAVLMDFEPSLARRLTAHLMGCEESAVRIDHMRDALGEVVNIVGGYIKQDLPPDTALSLPTLAQGVDLRMYLPDARPSHRLSYRCGDERLQVTVYQIDISGAQHAPAGDGAPRSQPQPPGNPAP